MKKMMLKRILIALLIGTAILTMPVMAECKFAVNSNPPGTKIYFDNVDTGLVTPYFFDPISYPPAPINDVKLVRDGYNDWLLSIDMWGQERPICPNNCVANFCYYGISPDLTPKTVTTPEFPSAFLPAAMIIGFLGAVLFIQRTREH